MDQTEFYFLQEVFLWLLAPILLWLLVVFLAGGALMVVGQVAMYLARWFFE